MKKILVILICFAVCACSKDEENPSQRELLEIEKAKVNQDSLNKLLVGKWATNLEPGESSTFFYFNNNFTYSEYHYDSYQNTLYTSNENTSYFFTNTNFSHNGKTVYKLVPETEGQIVGPDGIKYVFGMFCHLFYFDGESVVFSDGTIETSNPNYGAITSSSSYKLKRMEL